MTPDALADLHKRCFTTPRPWQAAEFAHLLEDCFLLTSKDGFLLARVVMDEAELLTLAVCPGARRSGQGRDLVARFLKEATSHGASCAFLEVAANNHTALALYATAGFTKVGLRKRYYLAPDLSKIDAVVMRRSLS